MVTPLDDEDASYPPTRNLAVIRYDGDPDVFTALAYEFLRMEGHDTAIEPPRPRYYRWGFDTLDRTHQMLREASGPGRGVWLGALVVSARPAGDGPVANRYCEPCDARAGERHGGWCVFGRLQAAASRA